MVTFKPNNNTFCITTISNSLTIHTKVITPQLFCPGNVVQYLGDKINLQMSNEF